MSDRLLNFRTPLASGDPHKVNGGIDELEEVNVEKRTEIFNDAFEMGLNLYDDGDGYRQQSVARFVRELLSRQHLFAIFKDKPDEDLPTHFTLDEMKSHIDQLEAFYLAAMDDDDGRVRQAAIKRLKHLSVAYQMGGDDDRLDDLLETLDGLLAETTAKKREHVERARDDVQLQRRAPSLHDILNRITDDR